MKKLTLTLLFICTIVYSQNLPERPAPPRLVNDFAGFISIQDAAAIETQLVNFANQTGTQIAVATVKTLDGYDVSDYAIRLAQKWQIGQKSKDNGVLILIKPRIGNEEGKVFIATGYGMEDILPDIVCKRIIENEMIPRFKQGMNSEAISAATTVIMSLASKKFTPQEYASGTTEQAPPVAIVILVFFIIFFIIGLFSRVSRLRNRTIGHSIPWWIAAGMLSNVGRGSGWNSFSSGRGSFGGGSFGGFGGGSFGGGGASGSW